MSLPTHLSKNAAVKVASAICILTAIISGCAKKQQSEISEIERFDIMVSNYPEMDSSQRENFISHYADAVAFVTKGDSTNTDSTLLAYSKGAAVKMFGADIEKRFTMADSIETVLGEIKSAMNNKLPEVAWKRIIGVISTYNQSIIMTDSTLLLGLNHYLGADYQAYSYFEPYQRSVKTPGHLPYDVAEALIANKFPYKPSEESTLLNRIIYEGALLAAINDITPGGNIAESMGYTKEQWKWLEKNERNIWNSLIERELLFSIDPTIADRMIRQAPTTSIITPDTPGRAGRYIGYKIVEAYRKHHPEKSIGRMLTPEFYNSPTALINAGYIPN